MGTRSSSASERRGSPHAGRLLLAMLLSLAAFFAAALRPVPLSIVVTANLGAPHDPDTPVAIDEGNAHSRCTAVRPARDAHRHGARDLTLGLPELSRSWWTARAPEDGRLALASFEDQASARRVRRHAELMVFLN